MNSHIGAHLGNVANPLRCQEAGLTECTAVTQIIRLSTAFLFTVRTPPLRFVDSDIIRVR